MIMHSTPRTLLFLLSSLPLFGALACQPSESDAPTAPEATVVAKQAIGESVRPIWTTSEVGLGIQPSYRERLFLQAANRLRMTPHYWSLRQNPMTRRPIVRSDDAENAGPRTPAYAPAPPTRYSPYMSDTSRWQAKHKLLTGCSCTAMSLGYDQMTMMPREREPLIDATCCVLQIIEGVPECTTGVVTDCSIGGTQTVEGLASRLTLRADRWALLNKGVGRINNEQTFDLPDIGELWSFANLLRSFLPNPQGSYPSPLVLDGGSPGSSSVMSYGIVSIPQPPKECLDLPNPCGAGGACTKVGTSVTVCDRVADPDDDCLGLCVGGAKEGDPCQRLTPKGENCDPADYPLANRLAYTQGQVTNLPAPMLSDGLHTQLGLLERVRDNMGNEFVRIVAAALPGPNTSAPFGQTPRDQVTFGVNYYGPNGLPIGTPTELKLVLNNACVDLVPTNVPATLLKEDGTLVDAPYGGHYFSTDQTLQEGCYPYVFAAIDGDGFAATYPSYGALQARIKTEMVLDPENMQTTMALVVEPDATCPIWTETRPDLSCTISPQECTDGDTRPCYTGLIGTQDSGICKPGTETCKSGRWEGFCAGQVLPAADDMCDDGLDNNCNGTVDDNCPNRVQPDMSMPPEEDMSTATEEMGSADMGPADMAMVDMATPPEEDMAPNPPDMAMADRDMATPTTQDMTMVVTTGEKKDNEDGCGCQSTSRSPAEQGLPLGLGLFGLFMLRRRRK